VRHSQKRLTRDRRFGVPWRTEAVLADRGGPPWRVRLRTSRTSSRPNSSEFETEVESEYESEWEDELEVEGEWEDEGEEEDEAEEFFKKLKGVFRRAAPFLKTLAKKVGPLAATAIGGPAAGAIARAVTSQLEGELEAEVEGEFEEMATAPLAPSQTFAEYLAAQAAATESESEAEALGGAAAYAAISPDDRRELERLLPHLLRGAATITRMLGVGTRAEMVAELFGTPHLHGP